MPHTESPVQALPGLAEAVASYSKEKIYVEPRYLNDGEEVWIPFTTPEHPRRGLKCIVACAAGNHARVVNEKFNVDRWYPLYALFVLSTDPRAV